MMKIGILGLTTQSGNKGCEALTYSFFEVINNIAKRHDDIIDIIMIDNSNFKQRIISILLTIFNKTPKRFLYAQRLYSNIRFRVGKYHINKNKYYFSHIIKECNFIFDFTAGDSFTDIYGLNRFYERTKLKHAIEDSGLNLVLGSQTIGPFNDVDVKNYAASAINKAYEVFVRDKKSFDYTIQISGRYPILTTDIAFALPYKKQNVYSKKIRFGFNPSGLLWNGGYTGNNQFQLTVDYKKYCQEVISYLIEKEYEVFLIGHAFYENRPDLVDNDWIAINELKKEFPQVQIAPFFKTPMEIKSFISSLDIFIGARMHATIGALSAGIPVIPFSYSRKFEGLFESLSYPYLINGCSDTTNEAVIKTLNMITNIDTLRSIISACQCIIVDKNKYLFKAYESLIYKNKNE